MDNDQENKFSSVSELPDFTGLKKKKKKGKFNLDELDMNKPIILETIETDITLTDNKPVSTPSITNVDVEDSGTDLNFDLLKKKKKKKVNFYDEDMKIDNETLDDNEHVATEPSISMAEMDDNGSDLSFDLLKKKKKKKVNIHEGDINIEYEKSITTLDIFTENTAADYDYEDLLERVYNIIRKKDPSRDLESKRKLVMRPPQVIRIGTKKSSFVNFVDICKILHRNPQHLQSFLLVELGTTGSVDGNNQLIIKGRFDQKQIEKVLRHYIKEYVTCHTCHSPETHLQKDIRLFFLQCESCGSRCSVASIKSGYQAVTGKRAAMRAKAN